MDDDEALSLEEALRRLVAEIAFGSYRDPLGHRLTMNTAYLEAVALLDLSDTLARGTRPPGAG